MLNCSENFRPRRQNGKKGVEILKLASFKSLTKLPANRHRIVACDSFTITGGDLKR